MNAKRAPRILAWRVGLFAAIVAVWQALSALHGMTFYISSPSAIVVREGQWLADGTLLFHTSITVEETLGGFVLGAAAGIVAGFVIGPQRELGEIVDPFIVAVYSIPKVALAPLFIVWFGIGLEMRIIFVATIVFFLVFLNTYTGVRNVSQELLIVFRLMGARERHLLTQVIIPSAPTWVFAGLRLSVPYALIGAIVSEMMASNHGLGFLLQSSASQFDTAAVFATLVAVIVLAQLLNLLVRLAERVLMPWDADPEQRDVSP